jgi:hypothetical protein
MDPYWQESDLKFRRHIADEQLRPFREAAFTWPIRQELKDNRWCNLCRVCRQNIWFANDERKQPYQYTEDEKLALIVAHIRQCHPNMEVDDVANDDRQY